MQPVIGVDECHRLIERTTGYTPVTTCLRICVCGYGGPITLHREVYRQVSKDRSLADLFGRLSLRVLRAKAHGIVPVDCNLDIEMGQRSFINPGCAGVSRREGTRIMT